MEGVVVCDYTQNINRAILYNTFSVIYTYALVFRKV